MKEDCHESEIIQERIDRKASGGIEIVLTFTDVDQDTCAFNIHLNPSSFTSYGMQTWDVLPRLGFKNTRECPVFGRHSHGCFYKSIPVKKRNVRRDSWKSNPAYQQFEWLVAKLSEICDETIRLYSTLESRGLAFPWKNEDLPTGRVLQIPPSVWLDKHKSKEHKTLEKTKDESQERLSELEKIMGVLFLKEHPLEESVKALLEHLGDIEAEIQDEIGEKGAPIDIKVTLPGSKERRFAVEVTGTNSGIRKDSKKVRTVSSYCIVDREEGEKVILLANTHIEADPADRVSLLPFSKEVQDVLDKSTDVLLVTTAQLYEIWRRVKEEDADLSGFVEQMYSQKGLFRVNE